MTTSAFILLLTGCVKPIQDTQTVYNDTPQPTVYNGTTQQGIVYETAPPIVYESAPSGTVYQDVQTDGTVITPIGQSSGGFNTTYPDPYANGGNGGTVYSDPYSNQAPITDYPMQSYPTSTPTVSNQSAGIHLQIAALKEYRAAEDYKNRLSLPGGLSAYVQRAGAMNKVIVSGIPSLAEANRLKETRFPGAFVVHGASSGGYTPPVQPNYDTSSGGGIYTINNPYGSTPSSSGNSGIGVQVGAFGTYGKAQAVANSQSGQYPATVKKIGKYYKVILTGFSSRSAAKAHASRIGGFVVSTY